VGVKEDILSEKEKSECFHQIGMIKEEDYKRVLKLIKDAEFKRRQTSLTIKVHKKAWDYGRRIPIALKWVV
jgi:predicted transcriptional regulator